MTGDLLVDLIMTAANFWWLILLGTTVGIIIGAIPGFGAHNTIIILLPFTLAVDITTGLTFMVSLYVASHMGAGIPSILLNIPGTGGAAATTLDGYPMAQQGKGQQALVLSFFASTIGGFTTAIIALFATPYLAQIAFYLHSVEMVIVMLFGITLIAVIASNDMLKGLISGVVGLLIGGIGADMIYSAPRATFGFLELYDGVPLIPVLIGLFAISEALAMLKGEGVVSKEGRLRQSSAWSETVAGLRIGVSRLWHVFWTGLLGLGIGAIPGAGASIASFVAYQQSRTFSKDPDGYGKGKPEGILAPESANNGVSSGSMIPLLVIGIPGGSTAAVMLVVLVYHGVPLGPRLFIEAPELAYGVFMTMVFSYLMMMFTILPLTKILSRVSFVPTSYLAPSIIAFTLVGAFAYRGYAFDMGLAVVFGILGYIAVTTGYQIVGILIGVILGPLLEENFIRALRIADGDLGVFFSTPIANGLWAALIISLVAPLALSKLKQRKRNLKGV